MIQMNCRDNGVIDAILYQLGNARNWKVTKLLCFFGSGSQSGKPNLEL